MSPSEVPKNQFLENLRQHPYRCHPDAQKPDSQRGCRGLLVRWSKSRL